MLKGISKYVGPELLAVLHEMGHGDEIILADAHFPGHSIGPRVIRADGISIQNLLEGIMPLLELDSYAPPLVMMEVVRGDVLDSAVERNDEAAFRPALAALLARVRQVGSPAEADDLRPSELIIPQQDASMDEVRKLLTDGGLIPG